METLTKEKLAEQVYWVVDGDGEDVQSGTYAEALSAKADCLDPTEVPIITNHVVYKRIELIGDSWRTVATYSSYEDVEAVVEDDECILTQRIWEVRVEKGLVCRCSSESEAEMERLDYLRKADVVEDIMLFDCWEYAQIYHAVRTGALTCNDDDLLEAIEELLVNTQATML